MRLRHLVLFVLIAIVQFGIFEVALRSWGSSEAAPSFQGLFETDASIGYRLKPHARTRFTTSEFSADIAINGAGLRMKRNSESRRLTNGASCCLVTHSCCRCRFPSGRHLASSSNSVSTDGLPASITG